MLDFLVQSITIAMQYLCFVSPLVRVCLHWVLSRDLLFLILRLVCAGHMAQSDWFLPPSFALSCLFRQVWRVIVPLVQYCVSSTWLPFLLFHFFPWVMNQHNSIVFNSICWIRLRTAQKQGNSWIDMLMQSHIVAYFTRLSMLMLLTPWCYCGNTCPQTVSLAQICVPWSCANTTTSSLQDHTKWQQVS